MLVTRRQFVKAAIVLVPVLATLPAVFQRAVTASLLESPGGSTTGGRTLVIVQMAGGNDGLNTVIPYADGLSLEIVWCGARKGGERRMVVGPPAASP